MIMEEYQRIEEATDIETETKLEAAIKNIKQEVLGMEERKLADHRSLIRPYKVKINVCR